MSAPQALPRRRVLVTGASDGIGRALVDHYAGLGWDVVATGRRPLPRIDRPLPAGVRYAAIDLTWAEAAREVADLAGPRLDLAILNAGLGKVASVADHAPADIAAMVRVNLVAPLLAAQALRPALAAGGGRLVLIGSTAARGAHRDFAVYAATKAALHGAARSLRLEWGAEVPVTILHPGPTATAMHRRAGLPEGPMERHFPPADVTARALARAIRRGGWRHRFGAGFLVRHALLGPRR